MYLSGFQRILDVLKVDIEGAEWPFLQHLLQSDVRYRVKQLVLEVHAPRLKQDISTGAETQLTLLDMAEIWQTMHDLERVGFRLYSTRPKACCDLFAVLRKSPPPIAHELPKCCYKVSYINTHFLKS